MALNFIKKVFSFGRKTVEEAPAQEPAATPPTDAAAAAFVDAAVEAPHPPALPEPGPGPTPQAPAAEQTSTDTATAEPDAPDKSFPQDGAMQFTPETAAEPDLAPAEPQDRDHAGEPPIAESEAEAEAEAEAGETLAPESHSAPAAEPAIEASAGRVGEQETESDVDANASPSSPRTRRARLPDGEKTPDGASEPGAQSTAKASPASPPLREEGGEAQAEPGGGSLSTDAEPANAPAPLPTQVRVGRTVSREEKVAPAPVAPQPRAGWWQRLRDGLSRSSSQLTEQVAGIFTKRKLDEETLQELEDVLIQADLGVETALRITDALSAGRYGRDISSAEVAKVMAAEITRVLAPVARPLELDLSHKPHVILVVGVNGTGKTTTIGKLAAKLASGGLKVTLAAGDTFRAAAIEQLKIWGERTGSEVVSTKLGADAAGLAYEALERARENGSDVVIIDTAGRLQNRTELMDELAKVVRVIGKVDPDAPHTVLQTLDATTGQNALNQVEIFRNVAGVNGLVMTKLDGTARGGILVAIAARHKLPVYFIGVGEGVDDLEPFEASEFAEAIVGEHR